MRFESRGLVQVQREESEVQNQQETEKKGVATSYQSRANWWGFERRIGILPAFIPSIKDWLLSSVVSAVRYEVN